jgi:hypothetical protein
MPATGFLLGTMRTMAAAGLVLLAGFRLVAYASDVGADPEAAEPNHAQEVGSELAEFRAASLPSGETYVSMQRVALEPGAEVAEPPIDGPRPATPTCPMPNRLRFCLASPTSSKREKPP